MKYTVNIFIKNLWGKTRKIKTLKKKNPNPRKVSRNRQFKKKSVSIK